MTCDARIRPFPNDTEVACDRDDEHQMHGGTLRDYAYPGSATLIEWDEDDRRTFHGEWPGECQSGSYGAGKTNSSPCVLPAGHRGKHAP
jgi:hypothetical protein